jgi:hypothetical protein
VLSGRLATFLRSPCLALRYFFDVPKALSDP